MFDLPRQEEAGEMLIFRCDRCGEEFRTIDLSRKDVTQVVLDHGFEADAHLCAKCADEFLKWIRAYEPQKGRR